MLRRTRRTAGQNIYAGFRVRRRALGSLRDLDIGGERFHGFLVKHHDTNALLLGSLDDRSDKIVLGDDQHALFQAAQIPRKRLGGLERVQHVDGAALLYHREQRCCRIRTVARHEGHSLGGGECRSLAARRSPLTA